MNLKAELVKRVKESIRLKMAAGKTFEASLVEAKNESCAGPAVWAEINKADF